MKFAFQTFFSVNSFKKMFSKGEIKNLVSNKPDITKRKSKFKDENYI